MFQILIAPGKMIAHGVSKIPKFLTTIYVGTNPPPKNMVNKKNDMITFLPTNSFFERG